MSKLNYGNMVFLKEREEINTFSTLAEARAYVKDSCGGIELFEVSRIDPYDGQMSIFFFLKEFPQSEQSKGGEWSFSGNFDSFDYLGGIVNSKGWKRRPLAVIRYANP